MSEKIKELEKIASEVRSCKKCRLWEGRKNAVPGEGNPDAEIMFIGEAPGATEDEEGRPFVGAAGRLLTELINKKLGMSRDKVYITNVVKCRPPENRDPETDEIIACSPYLDSQINIIKPKIIVTLGRHSTNYMFNKMNIKFTSITRVRGKIFKWKSDYGEVLVLPMLHPAAALYNPNMKELLEKDFETLRQLIGNKKPLSIEDFLSNRGSGNKK